MKKHDLPCCIVEDLLPNYVEHLTSETSCKEIELHLKHCESCSQKLLQIQEPLHIKAPSTDTDRMAIDFLSKTKKKNRQKILLSIGTTLLLCLIAVYVLVLHQFAFHFTVENLYLLSDGNIYFELQATGPEGSISAISYRDGFEDNQENYFIHMGYSLFSLFQAQGLETYQTRNYSFVLPSEIVNQISGNGNLIYQQGSQKIIIWDGNSTLGLAPTFVEEKASSVGSPFSVSLN